jgi:hypothetical protein
MSRVVAGIGVPHTPAFASAVQRDDPDNEVAVFYRRIAEQLDAVKADVLVIFDTDHLNTFFLDNWPLISVGVAPHTSGPNDFTPGLPEVRLPIDQALAEHVRNSLIVGDFDIALTQEFTVDHSILVPLHFIRPANDIPVVPVFISTHLHPVPAAERCLALGKAVKDAVEAWPGDLRVAVMGSGSFSLDVGGPDIFPTKIFGVPAPDWVARVAGFLEAGDVDGLVAAATRTQMRQAGNVGGELLNWIAMLGACGAGVPTTLDMQAPFGHGYGFWSIA